MFTLHVAVPAGTPVGSKVQVVRVLEDGSHAAFGEKAVENGSLLIFKGEPGLDFAEGQQFHVKVLAADGKDLATCSVKCAEENIGKPKVPPTGATLTCWFETIPG